MFKKNLCLALIAGHMLFNFSIHAFCEELLSYNFARSELKKTNDPLLKLDFFHEAERLRKTIPSLVYQSYFNQDGHFLECLSSLKDEELQDSVSAFFKEETLLSFRSSKSKKLNRLYARYSKEKSHFFMRARFESTDKERKAGFHRTAGTMYYVLPDIDPIDFRVHFVHEVFHKVDERVLFESSMNYSSEEEQIYVDTLSQEKTSFSELDRDERRRIKAFMKNALKRGFLAEFKVWAATYEVYKEMRKVDEIERVDWIEEILSQRGNKKYLDFIFDYYRERFIIPEKEMIFHHDLVRETHDIVIEELSQIKNKCDLMDDLKEFIKDCR